MSRGLSNEEHAAFLSRWKEFRTPGGVYLSRCKHCGFEAFAFADATIEEHDKKCSVLPRKEVR